MTVTILNIHIVFGTLSVLVGLLCLAVQKRREPHTTLGEIYHLLVLVAVLSGTVLALDPVNPGLLVIGLLTYSFTLVAYISVKRRPRRWLYLHAPCQIASVFFDSDRSRLTVLSRKLKVPC